MRDHFPVSFGFVIQSSSQVSDCSLKMEPSPHEMSRGCPSTHVIRWWRSPGMAKRGNGQNRADAPSIFAGHVNPTTAEKFILRFRLGSCDKRQFKFTFWIANVEQLIRPIASVDTFIVCQTSIAMMLWRFTVRALQIGRRAFGTVRIDAERVFAAGRRNWCR